MDYQPPEASVHRLGTIVSLLPRAFTVDGSQFTKGVKAIFKLPGGQLYYDSALELDSDGSRFAAQDQTGQSDTSLHQPNGSPVDANTVPFFVLPLGGFRQQFGIALGDIAAVIHWDLLELAIFADIGPRHSLGEGSIALHRSLGHETIRGGKFHDEGIDRDVITIVFPGSGDGTTQTPERIREVGRRLFQELGGNVE